MAFTLTILKRHLRPSNLGQSGAGTVAGEFQGGNRGPDGDMAKQMMEAGPQHRLSLDPSPRVQVFPGYSKILRTSQKRLT